MIPLDSTKWNGWDYIGVLAHRIQSKRLQLPMQQELLIELRVYELREYQSHSFTAANRRIDELCNYFNSFGN